MPIEINELNIRVHLSESSSSQNSDTVSNPALADADTEHAMIEKIVEQVLSIIKERTER
jgi:hypothetical protein